MYLCVKILHIRVDPALKGCVYGEIDDGGRKLRSRNPSRRLVLQPSQLLR
jgi:hypothetical protein